MRKGSSSILVNMRGFRNRHTVTTHGITGLFAFSACHIWVPCDVSDSTKKRGFLRVVTV
jgi:hypothetical protein